MKLWLAAAFAIVVGCSSTDGDAPVTSCKLPGGGACAVGESCALDCNTCHCGADGTLKCTGRACVDTGVPDTATVDSSPIDAVVTDSVTVDSVSFEAGLCDEMTCGAGKVCVIPCCAPPCKPARPHCVDIPSTCSGVPSCACMASECGGDSSCGGLIDGQLQCACF